MSDKAQRNNIGDRTGPWEPSDAFQKYMKSVMDKRDELLETFQFHYRLDGEEKAMVIRPPYGSYKTARSIFLDTISEVTGTHVDPKEINLRAYCVWNLLAPAIHIYADNLGSKYISRPSTYKYSFSCMYQDDGECEGDYNFDHITPDNTSKDDAEHEIFQTLCEEYGEITCREAWLGDDGEFHTREVFESNEEEVGNLYGPSKYIIKDFENTGY